METPAYQPVDPPQKNSKIRRIIGFGCLGLICSFIFILLIGVMLRRNLPEETGKDVELVTDSIVAGTDSLTITPDDVSEQEPSETTVSTGIGMERSTLVEFFEKDPFNFTFEQGTDVNGEENYVGTSRDIHGNIIQLIGPSHDLSQANITAVLGRDGDNETALIMVAGFAKQFDMGAVDWMAEKVRDQDWRNDFDHQERVGNHDYRLQYIRLNGAAFITLTVQP